MKSGKLLLASVLFAATAVMADTAKEQADIRYKGFTNIVRDVQYKTVPGFDDAEQLSLDLILPEKNLYKDGTPVVMYIHGGGWSGGKRYVLWQDTFRQFTDKGIAVACISYRLAKNGSSGLNCLIDCKDAARFLSANAVKYHLDPARFATTGHSAGGHLSLCTALVPNSNPVVKGDPFLQSQNPVFICSAVKAPQVTLLHPEQADSEGTITMRPDRILQLLGGTSTAQPTPEEMASNDGRAKFISTIKTEAPVDEVVKAMSPEFWLTGESPPILLIHGTADTLISVRGAQYFKKLADERDADVTYVEVENGWHDFKPKDTGKKTNYTLQEVDQLSIDFLIKHLLKDIQPVSE